MRKSSTSPYIFILLQPVLKQHSLFILIFAIALFVRVYRLDELTTFGRDQGIDFLTVKDMVVNHKFTLIGIKTSVGEFFQGPLYLYILLPFFLIFGLNPIAGPISAVTISMLSLLLLYYVVNKFFSKTMAIVSSVIFALSPQLIIFGNTPLYQHFLPLMILASIGIYLAMVKSKSVWLTTTLGLTSGLGMELHLLNISLIFAYFALLLTKKEAKNLVLYLIGVILGFLPTIIFELRHQFLNTYLLLGYFHLSTGIHFNLVSLMNLWVNGFALYFTGNNVIFGVFFIFVIILLFMYKPQDKYETSLKQLAIVLFVITALLSLKFSAFQAHYFLPLWIVLITLTPIMLNKILPKKFSFGLLCLYCLINFVWITQSLSQNHGYYMPDNWTMKNIVKTAQIIKSDVKTKKNYNVASLLDGDTRSYPLRYMLEVQGIYPSSVDSFPKNDHIYVVTTPKRHNLHTEKVWEITSIGPTRIGADWKIAPSVILYRIDKIK